MSGPDKLDELAKLPASELRARLPEVFALIDAATEATAPLVASLAKAAFQGNEGLELLREESHLPFMLHGMLHADSQVRSLTILQLQRLATSTDDITLLSQRECSPSSLRQSATKT